jgi:hypothetical protein
MKEHEKPEWQKAKTVVTDWKDEEPEGNHVYPSSVNTGQDVNVYHVHDKPLQKKHLNSLDKRFKKEYSGYMND